METPVLNKKQQKSALSAKKFKSRQVIKNVLNTPYDNQFWPEVSNEEDLILRKVLESFLPRIKLPKVNIPWEQLQQSPKADRKQARLDIMKKMGLQTEVDSTEGEGLILGINNITKCLETNTLDAVLITSDVYPRLMVQHLIEQSILNGIFILVVKDLRTLTKDKCGVESVALGIVKNLSSNSKLNIISSTIQEISEYYPVPKDHINYRRSLKISTQQNNMDTIMRSVPEKYQINIENVRKETYLIRQNKCKRIFVPTNTVPECSQRMEVDNLFMPLSDVVEEPKEFSYRPLKVKRVKSDVNRNKRISVLKNKR